MHAVFMYHSLDESGSAISLAPGEFERHLDFLVANQINVRPFSSFDLEQNEQHQVSLTFDDAFQNFADEAWPRLKERCLPATVFVVSQKSGQTNRWINDQYTGLPELPLMDWDTLGKLAEEGCEIGCHTESHQMLSTLSANQVETEIAECLNTIEEKIGMRPTTLAYPYGDHNDSVVKIASSLVDRACTTEFSLVEGEISAWGIPRIDAWYFAKPGLFEEFGGRKFSRFITRRRFLRRLRRAIPPFRGL